MKKYILLAAVAISLISCDNVDNNIDEPVAAHISATIGENSATRAGITDNNWDSEDCIGISMSGRYQNLKYITDGSGSFDGPVMYFKNKQETVDIFAYYPYTGSEDQTPEPIMVTTDANQQTIAEQAKFNFMVASQKGVTGADPNVNLEFSHLMSKLTLVFIDGNESTKVSKLTSYTIEGLKLDGTFNPATGECAVTGATTPLTMTLTGVESEKPVPSLLLFPQTVEKLTLKIKDNENQDYTCELKLTDNSLVSGNNYRFTITVKKTELSVNPTINPWNEVGGLGNAMSDD